MKLGSSDLDISRMGLGGNVFGWTADEATSHRGLSYPFFFLKLFF